MDFSRKERIYTDEQHIAFTKKQNIGKAIKNSRCVHQMTLQQLGDLVHIQPAQVQQFERGFFQNDDLEAVRAILIYFGNDYLLMSW